MFDNFLKISFEPIIDKDSKILILGSLPSDKSIEKNEYYGNKTNQFWNIISMCFDGKIIYFNNYEEKNYYLHKHHIALWDIYSKADRKGSLDSNIKNGYFNDIIGLLKLCPNINKIVTNGRASQKGLEKYLKTNNFSFHLNMFHLQAHLMLPFHLKKKLVCGKELFYSSLPS